MLEHIPEDGLDILLQNVKKHSEDGGIFIGSVATFPTNAGHHVTVHDEGWWINKFSEHGFRMLPEAETNFEFWEFCRPFPKIDLRARPDLGFHFVSQKR